MTGPGRLLQRMAPASSQWRQWEEFPNYWVSNYNQIFNMRLRRLHYLFINNASILCVRIYVNKRSITRSVDKIRRDAFGTEKVKTTIFYLAPVPGETLMFMCDECGQIVPEIMIDAHAMMRHLSIRARIFSSGDNIKEKTDDRSQYSQDRPLPQDQR